MKAKMKMKIELEEGVLKSFIQVCVCGGGCLYYISVVSAEARGIRSSWTRSWQLWANQFEYWKQNFGPLQDPDALSTTEPLLEALEF